MSAGRTTLILVPLLLSGCTLFTHKDRCTGPDCTAGNILDNSRNPKTWYCYGLPDRQGWDCDATREPQKIVAIGPPAAEQADGSASAPASSETGTDANATRRPGPYRDNPLPLPPTSAIPATAESGTTIPDDDSETPSPPASQAPPPPATPADNLDVAPGMREVLDKPADYYAVQLVAMHRLENILRFARQNGLEDPLYARISNNGSEWYVLLLGIYPDRDAARNATQSWKQSGNPRVQPWVRKLGPLQRAVRKAIKDV
jgi:septal ring-binding cell division protein DamX